MYNIKPVSCLKASTRAALNALYNERADEIDPILDSRGTSWDLLSDLEKQAFFPNFLQERFDAFTKKTYGFTYAERVAHHNHPCPRYMQDYGPGGGKYWDESWRGPKPAGWGE